MYGSPMEWVSVPLYSGYWAGIRGYVWHEVCQILHKSEESLHVVLVPRRTPFSDTRHFVGIGMYSLVIDYMAEAVHLFGVEIELALL